MKDIAAIIEWMDAIEFHDVPVENLTIKSYNAGFSVELALYDEDKQDYDYWELSFLEMEEMSSNEFNFQSGIDIDIYDFEYSYDTSFNGKLTLLLGSGKPSLEIKFKCKELELIALPYTSERI